jgi:hypothetical protein
MEVSIRNGPSLISDGDMHAEAPPHQCENNHRSCRLRPTSPLCARSFKQERSVGETLPHRLGSEIPLANIRKSFGPRGFLANRRLLGIIRAVQRHSASPTE